MLPGGEAGAMLSNDEDLIAKAYIFRDWGRPPKKGETFVTRGTKYRISEFAAAILMAQIGRFRGHLCDPQKNAVYLKQQLAKVPGIMPQSSTWAPTASPITTMAFVSARSTLTASPRRNSSQL